MTTSPNLGIPYIAGQQAQPEITHNEAINRLQALLNGVIDRGLNTPPSSPVEGDAYIVGTAPTGAWANYPNAIAAYFGTSWLFLPGDDDNGEPIPMGAQQEGVRVWVRAEDAVYVWSDDGADPPTYSWQPASDPPLEDDPPQALGTASAGIAGAASRGDHVHPHGSQGRGSQHQNATIGEAGFMSSTDKSKLDGVESGATADQTGAEIKAAYEGEPDTNAYTDAEKTKVGHIAVSAATDLDSIRTRVDELDAAVVLVGEWDASLGTFPGGGTAGAGESWIVNADGTVDGIEFRVGDRVIALVGGASTTIYAGNWIKADYTDRVSTVHGRTGAVVGQSGDYAASQVTNDSEVSGADVAAALDALDAAKANSADLGALASKDTVATSDIDDSAATNAKLAAMAANTIKARLASSGVPQDVAIAANRLLARASTGDLEAKVLTDFALNLLDDADAATMRATLGLGTAAQADTGTGLTDVPTGQDLQDGGGSQGNRKPIRGRFIPGGGNDHYLALIKKDTTFRNLSGILTPGATASSVGDRSAFVAIAIGQDDAGDIRGGIRAMGTFSPIELVQFDADGSSWIGLRAANVQTLGSTGLISAFFTGSVNDTFVWEAQTFASSAVTNVTNSVPRLVSSGAPGDAIGDNGALRNTNQVLGEATDFAQGSDTQSGDGSTTTFTIAHGLGNTPTSVNVQPESSEAAATHYVSGYDSTNITVEYSAAPANATDNLSWSFQAYREA